MGPFDQIIHICSFISPAWGVALLSVLFSRFLAYRWVPIASAGLGVQICVGGLMGTGALSLGLIFFGVDGKMATYAGLVLVCAITQWIFCRGWRR